MTIKQLRAKICPHSFQPFQAPTSNPRERVLSLLAAHKSGTSVRPPINVALANAGQMAQRQRQHQRKGAK